MQAQATGSHRPRPTLTSRSTGHGRYLVGLLTAMVVGCSSLGCTAWKFHSYRKQVPEFDGRTSHFYHKPSKEFVLAEDSCICRKSLFRQFAKQYSLVPPRYSGPKTRITPLSFVPVVSQPNSCTGLYYFYDVRVHRAKFRGSPVLHHRLLITQGDSLRIFSSDTVMNQHILDSYRSSDLYDSLLVYRSEIVRGTIGIAH